MKVIEFITPCKFRSLTGTAPLILTPYQVAQPRSKNEIKCNWTHANVMINNARSQMAASNTSQWLSKCQVVLNKRLLSEIILLIRIYVFEVFHNLSCWVLSQLDLLNFVTVWVFESCPTLIWIISKFKFLSFITTQVFEFFII